MGSVGSRLMRSLREVSTVSKSMFVCSLSWIQLPIFNMMARGLAFASSDRCLACFSSSWGGSEDFLMVLGSK